jgi:hypothetical protein
MMVGEGMLEAVIDVHMLVERRREKSIERVEERKDAQ